MSPKEVRIRLSTARIRPVSPNPTDEATVYDAPEGLEFRIVGNWPIGGNADKAL
jgi:hypothetical protein